MNSGAVIWRHEIPVDDEVHRVDLTGQIVHVDSRSPDTVEIWYVHQAGAFSRTRNFMVVGTGHPLPDGWTRVIGTTVAGFGNLVWHLVEGDSW